MTIKPMLAAKVDDLQGLAYPLLASPKMDGIRCILYRGTAYSRTGKPIPNRYVQMNLGLSANRAGLAGMVLDGELMLYDNQYRPLPFSEISSAYMSRDFCPHYWYEVFDMVCPGPYSSRLGALQGLHTGGRAVVLVAQTLIKDYHQAREFAAQSVHAGWEGIVLRSADAEYKHGRSTVNEQALLKYKLYDDAEFQVVGFIEYTENMNESIRNEVGALKKSRAKAGLVPKDMLGALVLYGPDHVTFEVGTGFTLAQRVDIWQHRMQIMGKLVRVRYQGIGSQGRPRFPSFQGFRDPMDR